MKIHEIDQCDAFEPHADKVREVTERMPDEDELYDLAELFKVFGDSTRIRILFVLSMTEMCVCDLAEALNSGKVYAAGLDVTAVEPIPEDNPLLGAKNCLITPHISWAAKEARQRILDTTVENVQSFLAGKPVNVVNG